MQLHELKTTRTKIQKRVGRGGLRGKTSGRGHKGQKARAGGTPRPQTRDIIKKIPKRRGFGKNRARTVNPNRITPLHVNVSTLEEMFKSGDKVTPESVVAKGLVRARKGKRTFVKILGLGTLSKKLIIENCSASVSARAKIKKAGGSIQT